MAKLFEVSNDIPPIHVHERGEKPKAHEGTLRNHLNDGGADGDMDDVNRGGHPDAHELETEIGVKYARNQRR